MQDTDRRCPACKADSPAHAKFCMQCGLFLPDTPADLTDRVHAPGAGPAPAPTPPTTTPTASFAPPVAPSSPTTPPSAPQVSWIPPSGSGSGGASGPSGSGGGFGGFDRGSVVAIACALLVLLVGGIAAAAGAFDGGGGDDDTRAAGSTTTETSPQYEETQWRNGYLDQRIADGDVTFEVTRLEIVKSIAAPGTGSITAGKGDRLVRVDLLWENNTGKAADLFCADTPLSLSAEDGEAYWPMENTARINPGICNGDILPGERQKVTIAFELPKDDQIGGVAVWNSLEPGDEAGDNTAIWVEP